MKPAINPQGNSTVTKVKREEVKPASAKSIVINQAKVIEKAAAKPLQQVLDTESKDPVEENKVNVAPKPKVQNDDVKME